MKRFNTLYITALITALLLSACNKQLDLKPHQQVEQDQAIRTATDVQITLVGAYNRAGLQDLYGGGVFLYPDLMASQSALDWRGTFAGLTQMATQRLLVDNFNVDNVWLYAYQTINQTNNVLANLDKVNAADKNRTEGESKFLRGMVYFDLVRLFGKSWNDGDPATNLGVPIVLTPTTTVTEASYVSRATVAQVYQQAIADLTDAETKLGKGITFFANSYSASAILARLYLQKGDFTNAAAEATKVIGSGAYNLNANYADEFPYPNGTGAHVDNTSEDIFAIQITNQQGVNYLNTFYATSGDGGRGEIVIRDNFVSGFEAGDSRADIYVADSDGNIRCHKFDNIYGNVHVIRLAELYLIRAESRLNLGDRNGALQDINVIRKRAGLANLSLASSFSVANAPAAIQKERTHELAFEGFFLHDVKRLKLNAASLPYNSPRLIFPIPYLEMNANKNLKQNEGY
ncbi:MAG: RagB/SusD family nutrient uptake outer membrane protein [Mucilaginibacter sp.]|uniref:RagB/SusD family nutrient uptake outer membrane protein n=1 Tax=Mucilaginibacter sp. TaxID=1882438 RepID=UPI0031AAA796